MQTPYNYSIQYAGVAHLTLVSKLFHGTQVHNRSTFHFVCHDVPSNKPTWYILLYVMTFKCTCMIHSTSYVWTMLSQYILLVCNLHSTQYICMIQPILYVNTLYISQMQDASYTVYKDVPSNTPARHIPHQDAAYSAPKLYILLCMQRCSIQYTCTIHVTLYGRMLYTTNLYYTSYLVRQDISITYTLCMSQCSTQHTKKIHSTWYVTTLYTIRLHNTFNLYVSMFQTVYLHDTSLQVKVLYTVSSCSISQFFYASTLQTIQLHDAFHFVCMDAPYNIFARYSLLCTSRFSIQYAQIIHPSLFFIIPICQDCQYHNLMQMCANSVL